MEDSDVTGRSKSFSTLAVAVVLFGLAGSVVAVLMPPSFATGPPRPPFGVFLVAGVSLVVLTAGLFAVVDRLGMGFGKTALALAAGYNALIATVKLGLAPAALYEANQEQSFDAGIADPNSPMFYLAVGSAVLILYLIVFCAMYGVFRWRFRRRAEARASAEPYWASSGASSPGSRTDRTSTSDTPEPRRISRGALWALLAVAVVVILAGLGLWWVPVFLVGLPALSYLSYIFTTFGAAIVLALGLAAVLAWITFDKVEQRAARLGDATLLASFFWLGLALILLYHVMWAVFLLTLVSIWPFRTYTPK